MFERGERSSNLVTISKQLRRFDVVGVTENMTAAIASLVVELNCGADAHKFHFTSVKVVSGRPTFSDVPIDVQRAIEKATVTDSFVHAVARGISDEQARAGGALWVKGYQELFNNSTEPCRDVEDNRSKVLGSNGAFECRQFHRR